MQGAWKFIVREEKKKGSGKTGVLLPNNACHKECGSAMYLHLISGRKTSGAQNGNRKVKEGTRSTIQVVVSC